MRQSFVLARTCLSSFFYIGVIPADTPFLLTTDPKYAVETANGSDLGIKINMVANEHYFNPTDVLKAFQEQTVIQTPEYEAILKSVSGVGGRFRPRNLEEVRSLTHHTFCLFGQIQ